MLRRTKDTIQPYEVTFSPPSETASKGYCMVQDSLEDFLSMGLDLARTSTGGYAIAWLWAEDSVNPGNYAWHSAFHFSRDGFCSRVPSGFSWP